ncbi:hypothetical protein ACXHXM_02130
MMDQLTQARFDKLSSLKRCPVCGSALDGASSSQGTRTIQFVCEAQFRAAIGRAIEPIVICSAPSNTAAEALNDEVQAILRSQAGAA